jgi:hypothetical protein
MHFMEFVGCSCYIIPRKTLYVVHDGAIYAAQTSDAGVSYHGYPYKGKLPRELLTRLGEMAIAKDCEKDFAKWVGS